MFQFSIKGYWELCFFFFFLPKRNFQASYYASREQVKILRFVSWLQRNEITYYTFKEKTRAISLHWKILTEKQNKFCYTWMIEFSEEETGGETWFPRGVKRWPRGEHRNTLSPCTSTCLQINVASSIDFVHITWNYLVFSCCLFIGYWLYDEFLLLFEIMIISSILFRWNFICYQYVKVVPVINDISLYL